ncbi:hypothetical protein [Bradyrhizobium sp. NBAIM08]|nr:hypothetical protein [Bradyrhizobium sp. NBAIM08]
MEGSERQEKFAALEELVTSLEEQSQGLLTSSFNQGTSIELEI